MYQNFNSRIPRGVSRPNKGGSLDESALLITSYASDTDASLKSCISKDNGDVCVENKPKCKSTKHIFEAEREKKPSRLHLANGYRHQVTLL